MKTSSLNPAWKRYLTLLFLLTLTTALASNFQDGPPLKAKVTKAQCVDAKRGEWNLTVKLLEEPNVVPSGFYDASKFKKGSLVSFVSSQRGSTFAPGDLLKVKWTSYGAMGANGPVGGLSWSLAP